MGLKTGLIIGFGAGYVLGAKAGKERYDQIMATVSDFTSRPEVQDLSARGKAFMDSANESLRRHQHNGG